MRETRHRRPSRRRRRWLTEEAKWGLAMAGLLVGFVPAVLLNRSILHSQAPEFAILKFLRR